MSKTLDGLNEIRLAKLKFALEEAELKSAIADAKYELFYLKERTKIAIKEKRNAMKNQCKKILKQLKELPIGE